MKAKKLKIVLVPVIIMIALTILIAVNSKAEATDITELNTEEKINSIIKNTDNEHCMDYFTDVWLTEFRKNQDLGLSIEDADNEASKAVISVSETDPCSI